MTYPIMQRELTVHLHNKSWYLRPIEDEEKILGPVDYGWHRFNLYPDSFTFGEGLLAGSSIPGSRRLVFCSCHDCVRLAECLQPLPCRSDAGVVGQVRP